MRSRHVHQYEYGDQTIRLRVFLPVKIDVLRCWDRRDARYLDVLHGYDLGTWRSFRVELHHRELGG